MASIDALPGTNFFLIELPSEQAGESGKKFFRLTTPDAEIDAHARRIPGFKHDREKRRRTIPAYYWGAVANMLRDPRLKPHWKHVSKAAVDLIRKRMAPPDVERGGIMCLVPNLLEEPEQTDYLIVMDTFRSRGIQDLKTVARAGQGLRHSWQHHGHLMSRVNLTPIVRDWCRIWEVNIEEAVLADYESQREIENLSRASHNAGGAVELPEEFHGTLRPYQEAGVSYIRARKRVILGDKMGLGKSVQSLAAVVAEEAFPCLIAYPAGAKMDLVWPREIAHFLPNRHAVMLTASDRQKFQMVVPRNIRVHVNPCRNEDLSRADVERSLNGWFDFLLVNYDLIWRRNFRWLREWPWQAVIFDEAHKLKAGKGTRADDGKWRGGNNRARAAVYMGNPNYRGADLKLAMALTGSAVCTSTHDVWGPVEAIGQERIFGSYERFIMRYRGSKSVRTFSRAEELGSILRRNCMIRRTREDVIKDLPPKDVINRMVEIDLEEYRSLLTQWLHERSADEDNTMLAMAAANKAREIAGQLKADALDAFLEEWAENTDEKSKCIVWAHNIAVQDAAEETARQRLGTDMVVTIKSRQRQQPDERIEAITRFQNRDGGPRVLIASIGSAGESGNLNAATTACFIQFGFSPATNEQAEDRSFRADKEHDLRPIQVFRLIAAGTSDEPQLETLLHREKLAASVYAETHEEAMQLEIGKQLLEMIRTWT